ncbi:MAG TPA: ATP F0F1 synthase synthase [Marinobacter sp.]|uniref:ATP F0F1 synthase synthase n=1 Tax=Marinobacter sp. TaxID=50741 RepID=UPI002D7ED262|nr:ATP F0F1 synthase synthase [Marinobacter sp.]HET8802921.1 ATP F0F1 synthase synthase [Marinobacter sp.]
MDHLLGKVKGKRKKPYFKVLSDCSIFDSISMNIDECIKYSPDHNLDDDSFFRIDAFSEKKFCLPILKKNFDSKEYDDLTKAQFGKLSFLISIQGGDFYFQKITPSLFVRRKMLVFGEVAEVESSESRLVVNSIPDAIYFRELDVLIFKNLATISSIFKGIDELYKEATNEEVKQFLGESFLELKGDYSVNKVSKPNRKRLALAMNTLDKMSDDDKRSMFSYVERYCRGKLNFDKNNSCFEISRDEELKLLLYGIEQRFYTTPFGKERRLANSVQNID